MMQTDLDRAHAAMMAASEDAAARLRFYHVLADNEVFVLLAREAGEEQIEPEVLHHDGESYVLVFDDEARLADFTGRVAPYAVISGRALAAMLHGQGMGLALNMEVAPSSILLPPDAVDWLAEALASVPQVDDGAGLRDLGPPEMPAPLVGALEGQLQRLGGLAREALLAKARYGDGREGHLLAILGALPGSEPALAKAVSEALLFAAGGGEEPPGEEGELDVAFLAGDSAQAARMRAVGRHFELPAPKAPEDEQVLAPGRAPGMDPDKPPKLR